MPICVNDSFIEQAHMSNYKSGYRLMSLSDLPSLSEVGFFDVFPSETSVGFDGTWSNYPYFENGNNTPSRCVMKLHNVLFHYEVFILKVL